MPLVKQTLEASILAAFKKSFAETANPDDVQQQLATDLSDAIDAFVRSGTVTIPLGVPVVALPPSGAGATTAPGIGTIS